MLADKLLWSLEMKFSMVFTRCEDDQATPDLLEVVLCVHKMLSR